MTKNWVVVVIRDQQHSETYGPFGSRMESLQYVANNVNKTNALIKFIEYAWDPFDFVIANFGDLES
jgi:hypothetical protein